MVLSVFKRYRYRAYPTGDQVKHLARVFGCTRVVYNDVIAARETAWRNGEPFPTIGQLSKRLLTEAKRTPQRAWLAEVVNGQRDFPVGGQVISPSADS